MQSSAIQIDNISKMYRISHAQSGRPGYSTLRESLTKGITSLASRMTGRSTKVRSEEFWALRDVTFEVQPGTVVGIIGRNGAGKSTLLKILSRITKPSIGRIETQGRLASLLEVGTGFHPELTGRENIYLNGAILGMSRNEIQKNFSAIVDFAEVEQFLDTPVKRFSSGMYTRLGFAVAAHLSPEILIVDEVLSVGDAGFQKKCLGKMKDIGRSGRTVLFVSHNMAAVQALCDRAIVLQAGRVVADEIPSAAIARFRVAMKPSPDGTRLFPIQGDDVTLNDFFVEGETGDRTEHVEFREPCCLNILLTVTRPHQNLHARVILWRESDSARVASITTREIPCGEIKEGTTTLRCRIDPNPLLPGEYFWSVALVKSSAKPLVDVENAGSLTVAEAIIPGASHPFTSRHGITHICSGIDKSYHPLPISLSVEGGQ